MTAPRRFLICRGFNNERCDARTVQELTQRLQLSMTEEHAKRLAHEAWDTGRGSHGLIEVERQWA